MDYDDIYDDDCFSSGDYLELDDLVDGESKSSSSDNSFCMTPTSVKYFDSEALLRDLGAKINRDEQGKDANVKLSVAALIKPNDVVMRPSNLGMLGFLSVALFSPRVLNSILMHHFVVLIVFPFYIAAPSKDVINMVHIAGMHLEGNLHDLILCIFFNFLCL